MILCGQHPFGLEAADQRDNIKRRNAVNAHCLERHSVEASDLVQRMVLKRASADDCINHPVVWEAHQRFLYLSELVRSDKHMRLPTHETLGIGITDWRFSIRKGSLLLPYLKSGGANYSSKPHDLIRMLRNLYQHPPAALILHDLADELASLYPRLFVNLHTIFGMLSFNLGGVT